MKSATLSLALAALAADVSLGASSQCRCLPGDSCWPSVAKWNALNSTVHGRLVATVPIGSPCHDPTYDKATCANLQSKWYQPQPHIVSSSSVMQSFFANNSCSPFTPESSPCTLGNYVSYAVNVTTPADVAAAVKFAQANNVRFVVRNTGHDYFGRSTGAGALSAWTHYLKTAEVVNYSSSYYSGPAVKAGAGISGGELTEFAHAHGLLALTGDCATVGVAGGFSQGGGHSALSTSFGLGADQVLEYEVVTTSGDIVTASPETNSDLYWALSGGGGGTYAIVTGITIRLHQDAKAGGASFLLAANSTTPAKYNEAVSKFMALLPQMTDAGASIVYLQTTESLTVRPITVLNATGDYVRDTVVAPWQKVLDGLGIKLAISYSTFDAYRDHYDEYFGPLPYGYFPVASSSWGSRLIPRKVLESGTSFQEVQNKIVAAGAGALGSVAAFKQHSGYVSNAILPAWRNTTIHLEISLPWNDTDFAANLVAQDKLSNELVPMLEKITPGSGNYLNEAGVGQDHWEQNFFGANYDKLLQIKKKWDPQGLLYGLKLVGSKDWVVDKSGRMCRA